MKRYLLWFSLESVCLSGLILSGSFVMSCQSKQQSEQATDSTATAVTTPTEAPISERLTALGLTHEGHWRSISLDDSMSRIKITEKGELFETEPDHVGYSVEFPNLESMDVLYYQNASKFVSGINVDLYLNSLQSVNEYSGDLTNYFTARYGKPTTQASMTVWAMPGEGEVSLKNVSKGKDFGLKIKFFKSNEPSV